MSFVCARSAALCGELPGAEFAHTPLPEKLEIFAHQRATERPA